MYDVFATQTMFTRQQSQQVEGELISFHGDRFAVFDQSVAATALAHWWELAVPGVLFFKLPLTGYSLPSKEGELCLPMTITVVHVNSCFLHAGLKPWTDNCQINRYLHVALVNQLTDLGVPVESKCFRKSVEAACYDKMPVCAERRNLPPIPRRLCQQECMSLYVLCKGDFPGKVSLRQMS